jgi:hypothetical protein
MHHLVRFERHYDHDPGQAYITCIAHHKECGLPSSSAVQTNDDALMT